MTTDAQTLLANYVKSSSEAAFRELVNRYLVGAVLVAALATPLLIQYQAQSALRNENRLLRLQADESAQLKTEKERLAQQLAQRAPQMSSNPMI